MTERRRMIAVLGGLALLAVALRFYGLGWGLPAVYEEAYPFKKSWEMWGWGAGRHVDFNPHFFNYPTFYFYVQFLGQGLLFVLLKLRGVIQSALDFRVLYVLDKTPFYLMARSITALCGALTALVTFWLGRRVGGWRVGLAAALLVAVNQVHIVKSQVVEVDVPLTLLASLCCLYSLRILTAPRRRDYVLAALAGGLATSTKYNGALLALPILLAHGLAWWRTTRAAPAAGATGKAARLRVPAAADARWSNLGLAAVLFAASFLATSPYVLLDRGNFWLGFNYERAHMAIGHFGLDHSPAILYYARVMTGSLLGWPLALLALAGLVWAAIVRRQGWALVLAIFPVVYVTIISSWSMKAERYVLPLLPLAAVYATALVAAAGERLRARQRLLPFGVIAASVALMAAPSLAAYRKDLARLRGDTRTVAREWIETNVPPGSFIVCESYGPEPFGIIDFQNLDADVRERIAKSQKNLKLYALLAMPMYQVMSENTALFYDMSLYNGVADLWVTSSSVAGRYRKDPRLYSAQCAFYDSLEAHWNKLREFGPADGSGPRITVYGNPHVQVPFAARRPAMPPPAPPVVPDLVPGCFAGYFERFGFLYEIYGYNAAAGLVYEMGLRYPDQPADIVRHLALGLIRTALARRDGALALAVCDEMTRRSQSKSETQYWRSVRPQLVTAVRGDTLRVRTP
jgi:4-amino-4-deoxy-L-arabinose transferase-like glycosyltransferase